MVSQTEDQKMEGMDKILLAELELHAVKSEDGEIYGSQLITKLTALGEKKIRVSDMHRGFGALPMDSCLRCFRWRLAK